MRFWDTTLARALMIAPPLALLLAIAFMVEVRQSTYLPNEEFVAVVIGITIVLSGVLAVVVVGANAIWRVLRPEDWR